MCKLAYRKFAELAFARAGIPIRWEGPPGVTETGVISEGERAGQVVVRISPQYFRPSEVNTSSGCIRTASCGRQQDDRKPYAATSQLKCIFSPQSTESLAYHQYCDAVSWHQIFLISHPLIVFVS